MTDPEDPGPKGAGIFGGRLVYDPSFATVSEKDFNELVALTRDGRRTSRQGQRRRRVPRRTRHLGRIALKSRAAPPQAGERHGYWSDTSSVNDAMFSASMRITPVFAANSMAALV